jgi:hypothetical protein
MVHQIIPHPTQSPQAQKVKLINIGLACLARDAWDIVAAITRLIQRREWRHA